MVKVLRSASWLGVGCHALVAVLAVTAYVVIRAGAEAPDVGAGLALVPVTLLGLPWSIWPFGTGDAGLLVAAGLNLVVHALFARAPAGPRPRPGDRPALVSTVLVACHRTPTAAGLWAGSAEQTHGTGTGRSTPDQECP